MTKTIIKILALAFVIGICIVSYLVYSQSRFGHDQLIKYSHPTKEHEDAKTLAILLHAFNNDNSSLEDIKGTIKEVYGIGKVDFLRPSLPLGPFSLASNSQMIAELILKIDQTWEKKKYQNILLVGHSYGALIARKLYVVANGEQSDTPFEQELHDAFNDLIKKYTKQKRIIKSAKEKRIWAKEVDRIILLAGINKGWSISHQMSLVKAIRFQTGVGLGYVIERFTGIQPNIMSIRKGAPFITQLRLQWLAMEKALEIENKNNPKVKPATTIQLLGTIDDLVSPDDNIDLATGKNFIYLEVPYSGHTNVRNLNKIKTDIPEEVKNKEKRKEVFKKALVVKENQDPYFEHFQAKFKPDKDITDVIFVIHGIRDLGHWTKKIARRVLVAVEKLDPKPAASEPNRKFAIETSTYGYFPMLSFLTPGARQNKVQWLMDKYTEAKSLYPNAAFHYVGHSHGTYLLAKALEDYESVKFEQVVFAGSVVRHKYEWEKYISSKRINAVQNFVTTGDWVVAFFPKALEVLGLQDLGSAGHDGFKAAEYHKDVHEPKNFIIGGHSAALQENMWDAIADFILNKNPVNPDSNLLSGDQKWWVKAFGFFPPIIWLAIGGVLFIGFRKILNLKISEWKRTLMIVGYLFLIWTIITRV